MTDSAREAIADSIVIPSCRMCGAEPQKQNIAGERVFGGQPVHRFFRCSDCDSCYLYPVPSIEEEQLFYRNEFENFMSERSGFAEWEDAERHVKLNQDHVRRRCGFMEKQIKNGGKVLELGCSSGFMLDEFRNRGMITFGVEPSEVFSEYVSKKGHTAYASLASLKQDLPDTRFDLICHFFVFEHIREPLQFMKESYELLNENGVIIAEIPCVNDPILKLYKVGEFEDYYWSIAHHFGYSPENIHYIMNRLGYRYELIPEQRYDLSNHMVWLSEGKPGGQGRYNHVFSEKLTHQYAEDLKENWLCDTMILKVFRK